MTSPFITEGKSVALRKVEPSDFDQIRPFEYSVSIVDAHATTQRLEALYAESAFWTDEAAAVAIVHVPSGRMIGTLQCYRSAPCIHGLELGYVLHDVNDRGHGFASQALRLFSDHLFATRPNVFRQQLVIEVWNTPSWKVAERAGFTREGLLRSAGLGTGDPADCLIYSRTSKDHHQELASNNGPT